MSIRSKTIALIAAVVAALVLSFSALGCAQSSSDSSPKEQDEVAIASDDKGVAKTADEKALRKPYYVLILGNDSRTGTPEISQKKYADGNARSDVMMLMRVDPKSYLISLLSIPRDTPYHYEDGSVRKINDAYRYDGAPGAVKAVETLTGLDILYYLDMGFVQFSTFYDAIGGIEVDVPIYMDFKDIISGTEHIYLEPGTQTLNGPQALVFARVRKQFVYGDANRQADDRQIVRKTISMVANSGDLGRFIDPFLQNISTDWPSETLKGQIQKFSEHADEIHFVEGTGPYDGDWNEEYGDWYCYENPELWGQILQVYTEGGDPQTVFSDPPLEQAG